LPRRSPKGEDGHALVADGLFMRSGLFYVLPEVFKGNADRGTH